MSRVPRRQGILRTSHGSFSELGCSSVARVSGGYDGSMNTQNRDHDEHHDHDENHDHRGHHEKMVVDFRRRFWISTALSVPVLVLAPMLQGLLGLRELLSFPGDSYLQFALASVVFLYGGWPFLTGLAGELRKLAPGMMTLIGVAVVTAYGYSSLVVFGLEGRVFFWELATLIDVMLLGHWIEMRSVMRASGAVEELVRMMPSQAHRYREDGSVEDVAVSELEVGDRVLVKPGEKVPTDGTVVEGTTSIDQSMLTGESQPVERGTGDEVIGGAVNGEAAITVEVEKTGDETYLSQVVETVRNAQQSRSRSQTLADRAAFWLTLVALVVGVVTLGAWLGVGREFDFALERMVTVMVITCPHALGLAVPLVVAVSTALAAGRGLLIRDRNGFELARRVDAIVLDKTGTLTEGRFVVGNVLVAGDDGKTLEQGEEDLLRLAASVESSSEHPIGRGIVSAAKEKSIEWPQPENFEAIPGKGARARVDGRTVEVVSQSYVSEQGLEQPQEAVDELAAEGQTVVSVVVEGRVAGAIALEDVVRAESREAVEGLRSLGMSVMMITGDSELVAQAVARDLGLDDYFAEVLPNDKAERIRGLRREGRIVAMVGDGVNDAPALAEADVGVAIGAGTDVAMESADIVLVNSDPRDVLALVHASRATYRKMVQNLWWASGYNVFAIPLAAGVAAPVGIILPPAVGAVVMSVSTVIVAINARWLRFE